MGVQGLPRNCSVLSSNFLEEGYNSPRNLKWETGGKQVDKLKWVSPACRP